MLNWRRCSGVLQSIFSTTTTVATEVYCTAVVNKRFELPNINPHSKLNPASAVVQAAAVKPSHIEFHGPQRLPSYSNKSILACPQVIQKKYNVNKMENTHVWHTNMGAKQGRKNCDSRLKVVCLFVSCEDHVTPIFGGCIRLCVLKSVSGLSSGQWFQWVICTKCVFVCIALNRVVFFKKNTTNNKQNKPWDEQMNRWTQQHTRRRQEKIHTSFFLIEQRSFHKNRFMHTHTAHTKGGKKKASLLLLWCVCCQFTIWKQSHYIVLLSQRWLLCTAHCFLQLNQKVNPEHKSKLSWTPIKTKNGRRQQWNIRHWRNERWSWY